MTEISRRGCLVCKLEQTRKTPNCTRCGWDFSPMLGTTEQVEEHLRERLEAARTAWRQRCINPAPSPKPEPDALAGQTHRKPSIFYEIACALLAPSESKCTERSLPRAIKKAYPGLILIMILFIGFGIYRELVWYQESWSARDDAEAMRLNLKAAEQGEATAQTNLGWMYREGRGVARDDSEAVRWYWKAAEQGEAVAQRSLGWMYSKGRGVARDDAEAVRWYRKAADQGDAIAQRALGWLYLEGGGVAQDDVEAVRWLRKAAEQDSAGAQNNLGWMYGQGRGVARDDAEAVRWYRKAAEQNDAVAQYNLGRMYAEGRGVTRDDAEAMRWYRKAAEQGDEDARNALEARHPLP